MPMTNLAEQIAIEAMNRGWGGLDNNVVFRLQEEAARVEVRAPSIAPAPGQDMPAYAEALLARFANPALNHKLAQIAMDGSQKIPQRWLETLAHHQGHGRSCPAILQALGGWLDHLRGDPALVSDPMADRLRTLWAEAGADGIAAALFGRDGLFSGYWTATSEDLRGISGHLRDT